MYIQQDGSGQYGKWELDANGSIVKGKILSKSDLLDEEDSADLDLNDDSHNGRMYEDVSSKGGIGIVKAEDRFALEKGDGGRVAIKSGGADVNPLTLGWKLLAAKEKSSGSGYEVYIQQDGSGQYGKWELDANGSIVKGKILSKSDLFDEEDSSDIDINDDRMIRDKMIDGSDDNMGMIESSESCVLDPGVQHLVLIGTANIDGTGNDIDNMIDGNDGNNKLDGKDGSDTLTGHKGADIFVFSTVKSYGESVADYVTDFNSVEGDRLQINKDAFGISRGQSPAFVSVDSDSGFDAALATAATFVYDSQSGSLWYNQNGIGSGYGSGGLFAVLDNAASLKSSDLSFV